MANTMPIFTSFMCLGLLPTLLMLLCPPAAAVVGASSISEQPSSCDFDRVFAFGDSLTDTGNAIRTSPVYDVATHLPYGQTYFHRPTGRFSDGRIIIDFLCQALGKHLLKPHLELPRHFLSGDNFAIAGATALNTTFLRHTHSVSFTPLSLENEILWFKDAKRTAGYEASQDFMARSLIYFGEIGGNDYSYWFLAGQPMDRVLQYTPYIQQQIHQSLKDIIEQGAKNIIVQANFPMGCLPSYSRLSSFGLASEDKDEYGCLKAYNDLSNQHNSRLKEVIAQLQSNYTDVQFLYLDAENAYLEVMKNPMKYGFTNTTGQCFDSGMSYDPSHPSNNNDKNLTQACCADPSRYMSWDGVHLTEAMYMALVKLFLAGGFSEPQQNFITTGDKCTYSFTNF